MWTLKFWKDTSERVIDAAAAAALGVWGVTAVAQQANWAIIGGSAAAAAIVSLLKCLVASRKGDPSSASLAD